LHSQNFKNFEGDKKMNPFPKNLPNSMKTIIKTWFCNYKGPNKMEFVGWGDKKEAINEIKKYLV